MKKYIILFICLFSFFTCNVKANSIKSIDMDVYINNNGNAHIKEVWQANLTSGTEGYKTFSNMGNRSIRNFKVSDDLGNTYTSIDIWKTNASFNDKAYKNGINYINNGFELCFGISKYGNRTYTLEYDMSNFVTKYTDNQGIYINLINMEQNIGKANIKIHSDIPFSIEENVKIWGFGYVGTDIVEDGSIIMNAENLSSTDYMTLLVRFESDLFKTTNESNRSFDDIYNDAFSTVDPSEMDITEEEHEGSINSIILFIFMIIFGFVYMVLFNPFIWVVLFLIFVMKNKAGGYYGGLKFPDGKNLENYNTFREIPCNKDLFYAYFLCYNYNIGSKELLKKGIIGALLLKWVKEHRIEITETKKGLFSFKDNNYAIHFLGISNVDERENKLYSMLKDASGANGILEVKEFEKWCRRHYSKMDMWFNSILGETTKILVSKGLIVEEEVERKGLFNSISYIKIKKVTSKVKEEANKLNGLKNFLLDTSMEEKKFIEVHLWEEYLIFAELFGISRKVQEQFSKLYPDFKSDTIMNYDSKGIYINNLVNMAYRGYNSGIAAARAASSSYSGSSHYSGGGGSSFSSGGHSSGGSSGGGFR